MSDSEHPMPGAPVLPTAVSKKGNGSALICTKDPQGFIVTLDVHRWEDHIIKRHPEMAAHLERVKSTIENPQMIQAGEGSTTTAYYYKLSGMAEKKSDDLYVLVVVGRNEEMKTGFVKTAHLLKNVKSDESRIVWLKNQS